MIYIYLYIIYYYYELYIIIMSYFCPQFLTGDRNNSFNSKNYLDNIIMLIINPES